MTSLKRPKKLVKQKFLFSKYMHTIKKGVWVVVFHSLHPNPFFIKHRKWMLFKKEQENNNILKRIRKEKIIIKSNKDDLKEFSKAKNKFLKRLWQFPSLFLMLTENCNYSCEYCPFSKKQSKLMTDKTVKKSIDFWIKKQKRFNQNKKYSIIFYGGEPLLNKPALFEGINYINKLKQKKCLPKNLDILLPTNGFFLDINTILFLKKHKIKVIVGLDGFTKKQNKKREDNFGNDTFHRSIKIIKLLVKNGIETSCSTTITPANIKNIVLTPIS